MLRRQSTLRPRQIDIHQKLPLIHEICDLKLDEDDAQKITSLWDLLTVGS